MSHEKCFDEVAVLQALDACTGNFSQVEAESVFAAWAAQGASQEAVVAPQWTNTRVGVFAQTQFRPFFQRARRTP